MEEQNEELRILTTEEKIQSVKALIEAQQKSPYKSRFNEILDSFEDFLMMRPEPPKEWQDRFDASGKKFDY